MVESSKIIEKYWILPVTMQGIMVSFKLDTEEQANIIPEYEYRKLKLKPKTCPRQIKISGYSETNIPVKGRCITSIQYKIKI